MSSSRKSRCSYISQRWIFTILANIGLCIQNVFSVIMSITIIEMVVPTEDFNQQDNGNCQSSYSVNSTNKTSSINHIEKNSSIERYSWDEYTQGIILSSFSWSNTIIQFLYGSLAEQYGGKHIFGIGILFQALITFITPFAIDWGGSIALIVTRVLIGFGSDGMFPVANVMIAHWTTPIGRTKIGNIIFSGSVIGLCAGTIVPALIIKYSSIGWPAVFYFFGIVGMLWFPFWLFLVYESPHVHPFISDKELQYLVKDLDIDKVKTKLPPTPWKEIFTCKEFWAFTMCYAGSNWAYYLMLSDLPKYMGDVVKFSLESNAYFSALPYLFMWFNTIFSGWINDKILEKKWMSLTNVRKLLTTVSSTGPAIFLLLVSYAECDKIKVVIMFMIGISSIGCFYTSLIMNPLDLSPNYAGSITSAGSGIASVTAILAPYLVGVLAPNSTLAEWRIVFWIVFLFAVTTNVIYFVWFKADVKPWNDPNFDRSKTTDKNEKKEVQIELSKMVHE